MLTNHKYASLLLVISLLVISCKGTDKDIVVNADANGAISFVSLSAKKIDKEQIKFGYFMKQPIDKSIMCFGFFEVPAEDKIHVPVPAGGIIKSIFLPPGSYVKAGSILANLENIDYLKIQQEFLETKNQYNYFGEDLKRQGELTIENASSVKKMQQAQLDYQIAEVRLYSLRAQLELLGIHADSVDVDHLTPIIGILAPVSGYLSEILSSQGYYIGPGEVLFEIRKNSRFFIRLNVPEQYFLYLQKGQPIYFSLSNDSISVFEAKLFSIGKIIDPKSRTFQAYALLTNKNKKGSFITGMSVKAKIKTFTDTVNVALSKAIIREPSGAYLIVKKNNHFTRMAIKTGISAGENTEIIGVPPIEENDSIVIQGLGYLNTLLSK
jgi:cobalt-zinc-cadmium efflux system membrane fusion protein